MPSPPDARYPDGTANLRDLPEHVRKLRAPLQVWDYIWFLQDRVRELESKLHEFEFDLDSMPFSQESAGRVSPDSSSWRAAS